MTFFADYHDHVGANAERFFKTTMFQSERMLVGLDCLEPGQAQEAHLHSGHDKCYYVIEGAGAFTIGTEQQLCEPGAVIWAPADTTHSVRNTGSTRLVMLIAMAPEPR